MEEEAQAQAANLQNALTGQADAMQGYIDEAVSLAMQYGPQLLLAIIVLIVGLWIIGKVVKLVEKGLGKSGTEPTLIKFLVNLTSILLKALLLISVAGMVGIETTSFIAILGAAGLAIGLALQGTLANFAGGVLILLFKPYRVGQVIDAQGVVGSVTEIQIFNTILHTPDNKRVIVPNGAISNGIITNITAEETRRVDFVFGIGYDDDIAKAKEVLTRIVGEDDRILSDPASQIVVSELADSSVNFTVRVWAKTGDYWGVYFDTMEKVKVTFDAENISIPYPQQDVHMHQVS